MEAATSAELWVSLQESITKECAALASEREALQKEKEEWEATRSKIVAVHHTSTIKLDVGGVIFKTTLTTLRQEDSMLSRMFDAANGFKVEKDEDGCFFIDRPGKYFAPILQYLQTGEFLPPSDPTKLAGVKKEVDFYQVWEEIEPTYLRYQPYWSISIRENHFKLIQKF